jgi:hypothetical protein
MSDSTSNKIAGIVAEMQGIEIQIGKSTSNDEVGEFMSFQFQDMKRELLKELVIELIHADVNLTELNPVFNQFLLFLSNAKTEKVSPEIKSSLREVSRLVAAA